jgi:hypothetical protein
MAFRIRSRTHAIRYARSLILTALAVLTVSCGGQSYSCGTPGSGHCYGTVDWKGAFTGFAMELTPVTLSSGNIFIDDEGWLVDFFAPGDPLQVAYWVEAGEWNEGFGTDYFWAQNTKFGGFVSTDLGAVDPSDIRTGNWIAFTIDRSGTTSDQWNVIISRAATGTTLFSAQSTNNAMSPNTIEEGQELAGQSGAQAPIAFFSQNQVIHGSLISFETADGAITADHPPNAGWFGTLTPSQTNDGGFFFTDCC